MSIAFFCRTKNLLEDTLECKAIVMTMIKISLFLSERKSSQNILKTSIRNKFESVHEIIQNTFDIFLVCETKIDSSFPNQQFCFSEYRIF